jgi:hypothetical protein
MTLLQLVPQALFPIAKATHAFPNEATGFEAKTIHRLLEVDPKGGGFRRDTENPLDR